MDLIKSSTYYFTFLHYCFPAGHKLPAKCELHFLDTVTFLNVEMSCKVILIKCFNIILLRLLFPMEEILIFQKYAYLLFWRD